jgi:predicted nuclease of predicted toxin-antitoxin system
MKIFVDENIPAITVNTLRDMGYEVLDIRGTDEEGMFDKEIWEKTQKEKRMIITTDKGFTQYRNYSHFGILIIRLKQPNSQKIHERVMKAINQFSEKEWKGLLVVMRDTIQSVWRNK